MTCHFTSLYKWATRLAGVAVLCSVAAAQSAAPFVYDTGSELLTSGDFNGDGRQDVLVVDKSTGNSRIGYLDVNNVLTWSAPLASGVENLSGAAVGRYYANNLDSLAATAPGLNRVNLVDLSNSNSAPTAVSVIPQGIGPHTLVTLPNPQALAVLPPPTLLVGSSENGSPVEEIEQLQISATVATPGANFGETGSFDRGNTLELPDATAPSFAVGLVRGIGIDRFDLLQFTNGPGGILLSQTNLPAGGDYSFGFFNGEALPRFAFYQPGGSNLIFTALTTNSGELDFDNNSTLSLTQAVEHVFYLPPASSGTFLLQFANGVQALRFSSGAPVLGAFYGSGLSGTNNVFTGLVPLATGQFVLLDAAAGSIASSHAQVIGFDGTNFTQTKTSYLPAISTRATRANIWLFQTEPFVNDNPGFIASLNLPDWSDTILGLAGTISATAETDSGAGTGLTGIVTNTLGAPPPGAAYALANQYQDAISIFSYAPPRAAEPVVVTISPSPGVYSGSVQISFSTLQASDQVFYRAGTGDVWHPYASAFTLTNTTAVQFYGTNSAGARSQLLTADYSIASTAFTAPAYDLTNGMLSTNSTSYIAPTNTLFLSSGGTIFYGRKNLTGGSIWSINLDGSGESYITTGARPRVSRDGRYLAFSRGANVFTPTGGDVWVRDLELGTEWELYTNQTGIVGYDWDLSEPPNLILDSGCSFWSVSLSNTATLFPLPQDCSSYAPAVNPVDGSVAYFDTSGMSGGIYTGVEGGTPVKILASSAVRWPSWSPDGNHLSFAYLNNLYLPQALADIYTVSTNGSAVSQITAFTNSNDGFIHGTIWAPNYNALVGAGTIQNTNGLWIIPLTPDDQHCDCPAILLPTSPGDPIDFAGSIVVPVTPNVAMPGLFIRSEPTAEVVYWSTNYQGFALEYATNLSPTAVWTTVTGPYFLNGNYFEYHESTRSLLTTKFFRLRYPAIIVLSPSQPQLSVSFTPQPPSPQTVVAWDTNYDSYILETTTNLAAPSKWTSVTVSGVVTNGHLEYHEPYNPKKPREFFRLRWP